MLDKQALYAGDLVLVDGLDCVVVYACDADEQGEEIPVGSVGLIINEIIDEYSEMKILFPTGLCFLWRGYIDDLKLLADR